MNKKGIAETMLLLWVLGGVILFFVPNKVSTALGVGNRQNQITKIERVDLIKNPNGTVIGTKTTTVDKDEQRHISFWEWLLSLPVFVLFLIGLGIIFPPVALVLGNLWNGLKKETKKIVLSVDAALDEIKDDEVKKKALSAMDGVQNDSTKKVVNKMQGKES